MAQTLEYRRSIQAPAAEAYRAFTRATPLRDWLCDVSLADARSGGRIYLWWNSGYFVAGAFTALEENRRIEFTWQGKDEPGRTRVEVTLEDRGDVTEVVLKHSGIGEGAEWERVAGEIERGWTAGLENLQSLLETGEDLRYTRRPMLGILLGDFTGDISNELGVPVKQGIPVNTAIPGMGAAQAGLQPHDVIVSMGGKQVIDYPSLVAALQGRRAGDTVEVIFYRGPERRTVAMTLSTRLMPEIPATPAALAAELRKLNAHLLSELEEILHEVPEELATASPGPGEWSALQAVAHLVVSERDTHQWLTDMVNDDERFSDRYTNSSALTARVNAIVAVRPTIEGQLQAVREALAETEAMVAGLPDEVRAHKGNYWRIGHNLLQADQHWKEHLEQVEDALRKAKAVASQTA
jgi:uncharacterized protein YndB with AHSA1/START domain